MPLLALIPAVLTAALLAFGKDDGPGPVGAIVCFAVGLVVGCLAVLLVDWRVRRRNGAK